MQEVSETVQRAVRFSWTLRAAALGVVLSLSGCATPPQTRANRPADPRACPDAEQLRARAERLWTARVKEDWSTLYTLQEPRRRAAITEDDFVAWCQDNEPFRYQRFQLGRVETDGGLGWVEVQCAATVRKFPSVPARSVTRWEKWRVVEEQWYPVPLAQLDNYPGPPAVRNRAEEQRLREVFEQAWQARQEHDWERLYALTDPRDHEQVSAEDFIAGESLFERLSCALDWVEVIGDRGRVRALYEIRMNDPHMSKMAPAEMYLIEPWVKLNGQWYRDLLATSSQ